MTTLQASKTVANVAICMCSYIRSCSVIFYQLSTLHTVLTQYKAIWLIIVIMHLLIVLRLHRIMHELFTNQHHPLVAATNPRIMSPELSPYLLKYSSVIYTSGVPQLLFRSIPLRSVKYTVPHPPCWLGNEK